MGHFDYNGGHEKISLSMLEDEFRNHILVHPYPISLDITLNLMQPTLDLLPLKRTTTLDATRYTWM
jgi:hypothetical protein